MKIKICLTKQYKMQKIINMNDPAQIEKIKSTGMCHNYEVNDCWAEWWNWNGNALIMTVYMKWPWWHKEIKFCKSHLTIVIFNTLLSTGACTHNYVRKLGEKSSWIKKEAAKREKLSLKY